MPVSGQVRVVRTQSTVAEFLVVEFKGLCVQIFRHHRERIRDSPPSTPITWPVTQLCSGSSSHSIAEAISFGSPIRPRACMPADALAIISFCNSLADRGVRVMPGATQLTRIPFEA